VLALQVVDLSCLACVDFATLKSEDGASRNWLDFSTLVRLVGAEVARVMEAHAVVGLSFIVDGRLKVSSLV